MVKLDGNWFEIVYVAVEGGFKIGYTTSQSKAIGVLDNENLMEAAWHVQNFTIDGESGEIRKYISRVDGGWVEDDGDLTTKGCKYKKSTRDHCQPINSRQSY